MKNIAIKLSALALLAAVTLPSFASAEITTQDVVRDARGNVAVNTFGNCVLTKWESASHGDCTAAAVGKVLASVYFPFNKATLTKEARAALDKVVAYVKENKTKSINIVGFTDTIGSDSYNNALSKKRATNVKRYIASKGFKHETVEVRGLGKSNSSDSKCEGTKGKAKRDCLWEERRVDIELN